VNMSTRNVPYLSRATRAVTIIVDPTMSTTETATENDVVLINGIGIAATTHDDELRDIRGYLLLDSHDSISLARLGSTVVFVFRAGAVVVNSVCGVNN
jgi:hypothetical protein